MYLKKIAIKNNKIPLENYNKILINNKLSMASLSRKTEISLNSNLNSNYNINNSHNKGSKDNNKELSCFTSIQRTKNNNIQDEEEEKEITHTIDSNKYVYNKKNIIIKKAKMSNNIAQDRPLSATPIYKRIPALNPSLFQSNLKQSGSFSKNQKKIINNNQNKIKTPSNETIKKSIKNEKDHFNEYKLNRYYSYGVSMTSPSNNTINKTENDKNHYSIN